MDEKGEVLYELSPKFNFWYELTMPTGKKIRSSFTTIIITLILNIVFLVGKKYILNMDNITIINVYNVCRIICLIVLIVSIVIFISKIVMQVLEYKGMSYKFYKDCLVFENNFLSQTRKTIEYSNIREVEIRRSVTDRIMNYGVIIIYTNADKAYGSATVLYAIKNTEEHYNNIESIIHNGNIISSPIKTGNSARDLKEETNFQNAMNKNETYNESNAMSDNNPLNKE